MGYSRAFGMRSFENVVRDGRFRVPQNLNPQLAIGEPVMIDPATPGFVKRATAAVAPNAGMGIAVYEWIQLQNVGDPSLYGEGDLWWVPNGRYTQIVHGPGAKIWLRNTGTKTLYDGRQETAVQLLAGSVDVTTLAIGAGLVPDGSGKYAVATGTQVPWLTVEQVNPSSGRVEARFNF